jgi:hypothetical protein
MRPPKDHPRVPSRETVPPAPAIGSELSKPARLVISAFIAFHLFAIVTWCIPLDTPLIAAWRAMLRPYVVWTGLFQKWDMFSPDPSKLNGYITAVVTYANGTTSVWGFPRMEELGSGEKYVKERYRKFANDNLRLDQYAQLWPDAARYIARQNNHPSNPPVNVELVRNWSIVPPPNSGSVETWNRYVFFRYGVAPGDLR